jgi:hypothetical protein
MPRVGLSQIRNYYITTIYKVNKKKPAGARVFTRGGRVVLLEDGRVVAAGPTGQILSDRALLETHGLSGPDGLGVVG